MKRRALLRLAGETALALSLAGWRGAVAAVFEVTHTDAEWHMLLDAQQYDVLRRKATEPPFSSPLDHEKRDGLYDCAGCDLPVFSARAKFDSGTGWPSFWKPLRGAVLESDDNSLGMERTEVRCRRCGGHLGHVFADGPRPSGLRYCMNGLALSFKPDAA